EEFELLRRCWFKAKEGEGQVVLPPARPGSEKHDLRLRLWDFLLASRTYACAFFAPRHTLTVRFIRSSAKWNVLPDWRARTPRERNSTNSMGCSNRPRPQRRTPRSLPRCCRCRTMDAIPRSSSPRSSAGKECWKHSSCKCKLSP